MSLYPVPQGPVTAGPSPGWQPWCVGTSPAGTLAIWQHHFSSTKARTRKSARKVSAPEQVSLVFVLNLGPFTPEPHTKGCSSLEGHSVPLAHGHQPDGKGLLQTLNTDYMFPLYEVQKLAGLMGELEARIKAPF